MAYPGYGAGVPGYGAPPTAPGYGGAPGYGAPPPGAGYPGQPPMQPGMQPPGYGVRPPMGQMGGPPQMDPQVQQWFMAVDQDRSGRITADELQRALVNNNWTQFNRETCRLMIGMFDKDFSGTIDMFEFQALWQYIQQWRQTFERYDGNRSGSIEQHELHQAYQTMGYNVSPQFVATVVIKFDTAARRSLTLDNFIQSCIMLKSLTDNFRQRDTNMTGSIMMNYEDFMIMAVANKP